MASFWVPDRIDEPELMDQPGLPVAEVAEAYEVLRRVNRQLGNLAAIRREFRRWLREDRRDGLTSVVLDLGSGSGDLPQELQRCTTPDRPAFVLALDHDPVAVRAAIRRGIAVLLGDALRLPFADRSVDLVTAVKFAHHFSGVGLDRLIGEMARVARRRIIILDIHRHRLAYWGFILWSRLFTSSRLVRFDGPLSVLRGFTPAELMTAVDAIRGFDWEVRAYPGFQLALVGRRKDDDQADGAVPTLTSG